MIDSIDNYDGNWYSSPCRILPIIADYSASPLAVRPTHPRIFCLTTSNQPIMVAYYPPPSSDQVFITGSHKALMRLEHKVCSYFVLVISRATRLLGFRFSRSTVAQLKWDETTWVSSSLVYLGLPISDTIGNFQLSREQFARRNDCLVAV